MDTSILTFDEYYFTDVIDNKSQTESVNLVDNSTNTLKDKLFVIVIDGKPNHYFREYQHTDIVKVPDTNDCDDITISEYIRKSNIDVILDTLCRKVIAKYSSGITYWLKNDRQYAIYQKIGDKERKLHTIYAIEVSEYCE